MLITENKLRKIIAEEYAKLVKEGALDKSPGEETRGSREAGSTTGAQEYSGRKDAYRAYKKQGNLMRGQEKLESMMHDITQKIVNNERLIPAEFTQKFQSAARDLLLTKEEFSNFKPMAKRVAERFKRPELEDKIYNFIEDNFFPEKI